MSCLNYSHSPAKWITVALPNGMTVYFELNETGSLKYSNQGTPIPSFIEHETSSYHQNNCGSSSYSREYRGEFR
jgi:hypothetical protein